MFSCTSTLQVSYINAFAWCWEKQLQCWSLILWQRFNHLQNLWLVGSSNHLSIAPVDSQRDISLMQLSLGVSAHTTGLWKFSELSFSLFIASASSLAPLIMVPAFWAPRYSRMLLSWSSVGGASVTSSSNSARCGFVWCEWSLTWSSVACSEALADVCFRRVLTRREAGELALWKRVITSRVLCWRKDMALARSFGYL